MTTDQTIDQVCRSSVAALIVVLLAFGWYFGVRAQSTAPDQAAQTQRLYLPLVQQQAGAQVTPTATATRPPATNPTATPTTTPTTVSTPTPTPTVPPAAANVALFLESSWRTSSASIKKDAQGGLHAAYYYYEGRNDGAPNYATYAYCAATCDTLANWAKVNLAADRDVIEVQLALTNAGQPRLLIRADSTVYPGGKDFLYAACDQQCATSASWQTGYVLTNHGTSSFDSWDDDLPQRSFALDPQGRPRLLYQDRNFIFAEPDHYGHYYVACDTNCTSGTPEQPTWQQTRITKAFNVDYEVLAQPVLTFTKAGNPRVFGHLNPISGNATPEGLYYFGCDTACEDQANWQRVYLLDRGAGMPVSWDLTLDSQDRPRVALYRGEETFEAETLLYLWCDEQCLDQATKDAHWQFNKPGVAVTDGLHPDLELNAQGQPRIAYVDDTAGGLGYAWCTDACESDNAVWHHETVEGATALNAAWPVALPTACINGLWHGLTPILSLDGADNATVAYDTTYHARCLYDDPSDGRPPFTEFHEIVRAVRAVTFGLE
ncbi:MAG: hypothetical protein ACOYNY_28405 [Caldilineaceae bacterium]